MPVVVLGRKNRGTRCSWRGRMVLGCRDQARLGPFWQGAVAIRRPLNVCQFRPLRPPSCRCGLLPPRRCRFNFLHEAHRSIKIAPSWMRRAAPRRTVVPRRMITCINKAVNVAMCGKIRWPRRRRVCQPQIRWTAIGLVIRWASRLRSGKSAVAWIIFTRPLPWIRRR